jgi:hypothetical protein
MNGVTRRSVQNRTLSFSFSRTRDTTTRSPVLPMVMKIVAAAQGRGRGCVMTVDISDARIGYRTGPDASGATPV